MKLTADPSRTGRLTSFGLIAATTALGATAAWDVTSSRPTTVLVAMAGVCAFSPSTSISTPLIQLVNTPPG